MKNSERVPEGRGERRLVAALIAFTLFVSCLPYLLGYYLAPIMYPGGSTFIGTPYNIDDFCNYLSWLRQMADGRFFLHNMFTTDPQKDLEFNLFFWLLGRVMALTHCSPQAALQGARLLGGVALLALIYRFYRHCLPTDKYARLTAFGFACLSSGFGWVVWQNWQSKNLPGGPVDSWQPEAYTFLSIYTSALMTVSTVFILGTLYALLLGEQTGKWKYAVIAGVCGGILGNIHSYDVLHLCAAWGLYLVVQTFWKRGRGMAKSWAQALAALALTLPTTLYMYYVFSTEAVFRQRANVPTLSPHFWYYIAGYGLEFLLAVLAVGIAAFNAARAADPDSPEFAPDTEKVSLLFPLCWSVAGFLVIYLPFAFQRKMLMGEHIPLCLLAGVGAAWLTRRLGPRLQVPALCLLVLASLPSNAFFLARDFRHLPENRSETYLLPFLNRSLTDVYRWLRANTAPDAAIVGPPGYCAYLPGTAGRVVWAGHWAETPSYGSKELEFDEAFDRNTSEADRQQFLQSTRANYLFYPNDMSEATYRRHGEVHSFAELTAPLPASLTPVYRNEEFTIYKIGSSALNTSALNRR